MFNRVMAAGGALAAMLIAGTVQAAAVPKVAGPAPTPLPSVERHVLKVHGRHSSCRRGHRHIGGIVIRCRRGWRGWRYRYWRPRLNRCGVVYNRCYARYGRGSRAYYRCMRRARC
jgi:hypothetical protein